MGVSVVIHDGLYKGKMHQMVRDMQKIYIDDISPGTIVAKDIFNSHGTMLVSRGTVVVDRFIRQLDDIGIKELYVEEHRDENTEDSYVENSISIEEEQRNLPIDDVIYEKTRVQAHMQVKKIMVRYSAHSHLNIDRIHKIVESIIEQLLSRKEIVLTLSQLRSIDDYTYEHSVNVSVLSLIVGIDMGLGKESLDNLGTGAMLHDIGKAIIPDNVLKKPSKLTGLEFNEIKKHTEYGYEILTQIDLPEEAASIALHHHEKYDGSGYPRKLKGEQIPLFSRIVAIADVYDAISNDRVYKRKFSPDKVYRQIAQLGSTHFDPAIMEKFVSHLALYPNGSGIILNTNHKGIVIGQNKLLPQSPVVRIFRKDRSDIRKLYVDVDLSQTKFLYIKETF